ncbi:MAG TPA: ABC transporter ATP-binding protein [Anaerolineaceae bacterium]|nr:ABC transporter ATP-binding protein [Chloroflexota bacterium]HNY83968.1 ABC transporter ATP-binding protein [Anaerolineaceae bacterium]
MTSNLIVEAKNVRKSFGGKLVLDGVDFDLPQGMIYAICGSNGSGKSVFLRNLIGLMLPDSGEIKVFGRRIGKEVEFAPDTGALIDQAGFLLNENALFNLMLLAKISGAASPQRVSEALRFVGLDPEDKMPVKAFSVGMRQRLGIAQAIMEDPKLLILDEPTAGLDFDGQREIYDYLIQLKQMGKTILFTSHNQNEIKLLCDRVYLMKSGKLTLWTEMLVDQDERAAYEN